jgi:hypothetical protein
LSHWKEGVVADAIRSHSQGAQPSPVAALFKLNLSLLWERF